MSFNIGGIGKQKRADVDAVAGEGPVCPVVFYRMSDTVSAFGSDFVWWITGKENVAECSPRQISLGTLTALKLRNWCKRFRKRRGGAAAAEVT